MIVMQLACYLRELLQGSARPECGGDDLAGLACVGVAHLLQVRDGGDALGLQRCSSC